MKMMVVMMMMMITANVKFIIFSNHDQEIKRLIKTAR